jgi:membrane-associated phospholipid phosphatase
MPSLHIGWSTWCALAVWPLLRRRWTKIAVLFYPLATLFCIIVTANHFWLDGVGGLAVFAVGSLIGWGMHRWNQNRLDRREMLDAMLSERSGKPVPDIRISSLASEIIDDVSGDHDGKPSTPEF